MQELLRNRILKIEHALLKIASEVEEISRICGIKSAPSPSTERREVELGKLSTRELDVLRAFVQHKRVALVASGLFISPYTVRNHLKSIFRKLGVHSQVELLDLVQNAGLQSDEMSTLGRMSFGSAPGSISNAVSGLLSTALGGGVLVMDEDKRVVSVNSTMAQLLRAEVPELVGVTLADLPQSPLADAVRELSARTDGMQDGLRIEVQALSGIEVLVHPMLGPTERVVQWVVSTHVASTRAVVAPDVEAVFEDDDVAVAPEGEVAADAELDSEESEDWNVEEARVA